MPGPLIRMREEGRDRGNIGVIEPPSHGAHEARSTVPAPRFPFADRALEVCDGLAGEVRRCVALTRPVRTMTIGACLQLFRLVSDAHEQSATRELLRVRYDIRAGRLRCGGGGIEGGNVELSLRIKGLRQHAHDGALACAIGVTSKLRHEIVGRLAGEAWEPRGRIALPVRPVTRRTGRRVRGAPFGAPPAGTARPR